MNNACYMYAHPNPYLSYVPMHNWGNIWGSGYWNMSNVASYTNQFSPCQNTQRNTLSPILKDYGG